MINRLSREDFIELGVSVRTHPLIEWVTATLAATKGREKRLDSRGVKASELTGIQDLLAIVEKRRDELGNPLEPSSVIDFAHGIREEALKYRREIKRIAEIEFGTAPDLLAKFRTGVRTGRLVLPLKRELEFLVALLREHASQLASLGGTEGFIGRGVHLIEQLREVKEGLDAAFRALPPPAAQQCHDKGLLLDLTRRLVRIARLEFAEEPEDAAAFTFQGLRRKGAGSAASKIATP